MTVFNVTAGNMFNIIIIAAGIGICGMNIVQVSTGARLSKEATRYFQLFFGMVLLYIGSHLARQLMEGIPGRGIRVALITVTLLEFLASGMMAYLFSLLTLHVASPERHRKTLQRLLLGMLINPISRTARVSAKRWRMLTTSFARATRLNCLLPSGRR